MAESRYHAGEECPDDEENNDNDTCSEAPFQERPPALFLYRKFSALIRSLRTRTTGPGFLYGDPGRFADGGAGRKGFQFYLVRLIRFTGGEGRSGPAKVRPAQIAVIRIFKRNRGAAGRTPFLCNNGRWCCRPGAGLPGLHRGDGRQPGTAFITKNSLRIADDRSTDRTLYLLFFRDLGRQPGTAFVTEGSFIIGIFCPAFRAELDHTCVLVVFYLR